MWLGSLPKRRTPSTSCHIIFNEGQLEGVDMESEKVYFIYVTENLINGKLYIGQHTCNYDKQFTDGYLGSGRALKNAVKKYGAENFSRIILEYAESPEELNELEAKYVDEEVMSDVSRFYNLKTGGKQNTVFSEETRKKISISNTGKHPSEETREKLRIGHLGQKISEENLKKLIACRKGIPLSEEHKRKISESNKGKKRSSEFCQKLSERMKGKQLTEEQKQKISLAMKGKQCSEETRKKMSDAKIGNQNGKGHASPNKGKHLSEETRRKMSESRKGHVVSDETRRKISEHRKGKPSPYKGVPRSEETKRKISEARRRNK